MEDDAVPAPVQMRKGEFLAAVRPAVCAAADAELARAGQTTEACPYLERTFDRAAERSPAHLERLVRRYAPEAEGATSARDYIPLVATRAARAAATWADTGKLDLPPELAAESGDVGGLLGGLGAMVGGALSGIASAVSGIFSGIGRLFTLARDSSPTPADPSAVRASLGSGHPMDSDVRSQFESAFGHDFSAVRIHTDGVAEPAAAGLQARAFTIGTDVAFASGEYRPSTPEGAAVLAHELAHVAQHGVSPAPSSTPQPETGEEAEALEADADAAASAALARASKPAGTDGLEFRRARTAVALLRGEAGPRLRSGLRIHRCPGPSAPVRSPTQGVTAPPATTPTAAPGNSCGGPSQAQAYVPTEEGAIQPELKPDEFGKTSKLGAYFTFGACLVGGEWRFQLTSLRVPITSAVRPPDFRIEVGSAADSAVTRDSFAKITSDLSPTRHVSAEVTCGYDTWTDDVTTYSRRRTYWKRQLVVNHEAFHRQDWDTIYRKHLIEAEANVWAYRAPADIAASPAAAVAHERKALDDLMAAAYRPTCQEYTPHQESRAYDAGAPAYQTLVDDIRRRATAEKWT